MKNITICFVIAAYGCLLTNCTHEHPKRVHFVDREKYDKLTTIIPVKTINGQTINVLFDTGAPTPALDSAFFCEYLLPEMGDPDQVVQMGSPWAASANGNPTKENWWYHKPIYVNICNTEIGYDNFLVHDMNGFRIDVDGVFGLPKSDTTHVWELNFENNYLEIRPANNFKMPEGAYVFPLTYEDYPRVQFPIFIQNSNGDAITIDYPYLIDTGLTMDFVLFGSDEEVDFFSRRDDVVLLSTVFGSSRSRYSVEAKLFDSLDIDDLRIYVDGNSGKAPLQSKGVIGMNFLKRFNVFFDFTSRQVAFLPIKNYVRVIDPFIQRYYYSTHKSQDGRLFVLEIADMPDNHYKEAGLEKGDEIIAINGHQIKDLTKEESIAIRESTERIMDILRDEKQLRITVVLDGKDIEGE